MSTSVKAAMNRTAFLIKYASLCLTDYITTRTKTSLDKVFAPASFEQLQDNMHDLPVGFLLSFQTLLQYSGYLLPGLFDRVAKNDEQKRFWGYHAL